MKLMDEFAELKKNAAIELLPSLFEAVETMKTLIIRGTSVLFEKNGMNTPLLIMLASVFLLTASIVCAAGDIKFVSGGFRGFGDKTIHIEVKPYSESYAIMNAPIPKYYKFNYGQKIDVKIRPLGKKDAWFFEFAEFVEWGPQIIKEIQAGDAEGFRQEQLQRKMEQTRKENELRIANEKVQARNQAKTTSKQLHDDFTNRNRITRYITVGELSTNPFLYKNEIVGVFVTFDEMMSEKEGIFQKDDYIVVDNTPLEKFTQKRKVLLAAKVLGKKMIKLPMLGELNVPYMNYIDSFFCKDSSCSELLLWQEKN